MGLLIDREKVIKGLEHCTAAETSDDCNGCPYDGQCGTDPSALERDALELLKEQEESIPISWLTEKLEGHPEIPYAITDGIIHVLTMWEGR